MRFVGKLNPRMIAPQHGTIFREDNVEKFLNWLEALEVGIDAFEEEFYGDWLPTIFFTSSTSSHRLFM
ncbi:MAG: hypothetical protein J7L37_03210 [Thermococcus sp.]|nr:hypothetical protein [Thermococcus sp.]